MMPNLLWIIGPPFLKWFALCYQTIVLSWLSCPVCDVSVLCPNGWMDQNETWHGGGLGPGHIVLDADPAVPQKGYSPHQFSAHVRCGQTAGWIKMPLGMEIGLGSGDFVLDGDSAPRQEKGHSPQFSAHVYCGQTAGCIRSSVFLVRCFILVLVFV